MPRPCKRPTGQQFQSTPPARGATEKAEVRSWLMDISIHAPREGGDVEMPYGMTSITFISIHAPREGGDAVPFSPFPVSTEFQSTPPARGATNQRLQRPIGTLFQSTPPARGATACPQR